MFEHLHIVDYFVVGITLMIPVLIGVYHGYNSKHTTEDILVGSRGMSVLPVAASMMVTFFSAIAILGYPAEVYTNGIQIVMLSIMIGIIAPISGLLFVPVLYNLKLTSSFEYMEKRFDSLFVRQLASSMFLLYQVALQSIVIYAPSLALESIIGIPMWLSIVGLGFICTIYTAMGGYKAVVWTDFFQLIILMVGMLAIMLRAMVLSGGFVETFRIASEHGRLNFLDFTIDPFMRHNTFNFVFGYGLKVLFSYSTHQNQVQRFSSVRSQNDAIKSIALSSPFNVVSTLLVGVTGLAIFAAYINCDPIKAGMIKKSDQIVPYFVVEHLAVVPGILGLFLSCVFCAVLSTFSSGLNCIAAVLWEDFLTNKPYCKDLTPKTKANISRGIALFFGIGAIGLAFLGPYMGPILQVTLACVGAFLGATASLFVLGIFVPFANKFGAAVGLLAGLAATFFIIVQSFILNRTNPGLPTSIEGCQLNNSTLSIMALSTGILPPEDLEWPEKLYTLSYLHYSTVGIIVTISTGIIVSIITGGCSTVKNVESIYIHPWLRDRCNVKKVLERTSSPSEQEIDALMTSLAFKSGRFSKPRLSDTEIAF